MKNKILMLLLVLVLVTAFCVTACQKKPVTQNGGEVTDAPETEAPELDDKPDIKDGILTFREGDGVTFDVHTLYKSQTKVTLLPQTYEAWVKIPEGHTGDVGAILGDYSGAESVHFLWQIKANGVPSIYYQVGASTSQSMEIDFKNVSVPTGKWVHLAIVDDVANGAFYCYLDGELAQKIELSSIYKKFSRKPSNSPYICLGGDNRDGNTYRFKGALKAVVIYKSARTQDEVKSDMTKINIQDTNLISCYDISNSQGKKHFVDHKGKFMMLNNRLTPEWLEPSQVSKLKDYDYSIAVLGDTQMLSAYYPEEFAKMFDWLLANKDSHKIDHVLNLGDITNFNYDEEWEYARKQYFRLNGILDYTLVRGDHDVKSDKISNGDDKIKYDKYFGVDEYLSRFNAADSGYLKSAGESITNSYRKVKIGGNDYLIVTLDFDPSSTVLKWAGSIIAKYPECQVIITTHRYLMPNGTRMEEGESIWGQLALKYSNVKYCIGGHKISADTKWVKEKGKDGTVVSQLLVNPQGAGMDNNGALGMVYMMYFKNGSEEVQVRYYSTLIDKFYGKKNQFSVKLNDLTSVRFTN